MPRGYATLKHYRNLLMLQVGNVLGRREGILIALTIEVLLLQSVLSENCY